MTDKQFIQFSKKYFGDLDYKQLSEAEYKNLYEQKEAERIVSMANAGKLDGIFDKLAEYKNLYEQKEAERIVSMANAGKLDGIFDKLSLKADGMKVSLMYNGKAISSTTLVYINPSEIKLR